MENMILRNLMSSSAYDTARTAMALEEKVMAEKLANIQHSDGSWGCQLAYFHDRILSTYGVIRALEQLGGDITMIEKGKKYIRENMTNLAQDVTPTFGFDFIAERIIQEYGLLLPDMVLHYGKRRQKKLEMASREMLLSDRSTILHYAELLEGTLSEDEIHELTKMKNLVCSPSATAWLYAKTGGKTHRRYLRDCLDINGFAPTLYPIEIFGSAWICYNSLLVGVKNYAEAEFLSSSWNDDGLALSKDFPIVDLDTTAMVFRVLEKAEDALAVFEQFEAAEYFVCYKNERVPSVGANIHMLDAIKNINTPQSQSWKEKIVKYLRAEIVDGSFWSDKWHLSPYYTTSHGIVALSGIDDRITQNSVEWILKTQKADGSWGVFDQGTCEETAYCVLSLYYIKSEDERIREAIEKGKSYLLKHFESYTYPELWVGKVLYCHIGVVKSAIECAIIAGEKVTR